MPRKKLNRRTIEEINPESRFETLQTKETSLENQKVLSKKNIILFLILIAVIVFWKFRGLIIAATVNGQPISRMELNNQLQNRFGSQVLDNLINERLIMGALRQKGIFITNEEIDSKVSEIEKRLNGKVSLADALTAQGLTKEDFRRQLEMQLSIDKMFTLESTVSAKEIDDYMLKNSQSYKKATDPSEVKREITDIIHQQKVTEAFDKWFEDVRKTASIKKYI